MQKFLRITKNNQIMSTILGLLFIIFSIFICSCSSTNNTQIQNIKDVRGKNISVNLPINKVISAHNPTLNHLIVLGNGTSKYIIGFGRKDIAQNLYSKILTDWNELEIIGNDSTPVNKETITKLNPDLIILPEYNWQTKEKDYEGTNIPTFVCFPKEESFNSVTDTLEILAKLFNNENRANKIKETYHQIINEATNAINNTNYKPKVAFFGPRLYSIATTNMLQNQLIEKAGGQACAPKDLGENFSNIEPETILNINPEYIFIPSYAEYSVTDILNDAKLSNISAIKNKNVYKFPCKLEPWDMPTCSSALGVAWLTNMLHPDCYSKEKLVNNAISFYRLLYNYEFSETDFGIS